MSAHALLIGVRTSQARALVAQVTGREHPEAPECWATDDLATLAVFIDDGGKLHIDALPALLLPTDGGFRLFGENAEESSEELGATWIARSVEELRSQNICPPVVPESSTSNATESEEVPEGYWGGDGGYAEESEGCKVPEPEVADTLWFATTKALCISSVDCSSVPAGCDCGFKSFCGRNDATLTWLDGADPTTVSARHGRGILSKVARALWEDGDGWGEPPPPGSSTIVLKGREVDLETVPSCLAWKEGVLYETATYAVGEDAAVLARADVGRARSDLAETTAVVDFERVRREHPAAIEAAGTRDHELLYLKTPNQLAILHGPTEVLGGEHRGADLVMAERAEGARALEWMREVDEWRRALATFDQQQGEASR